MKYKIILLLFSLFFSNSFSQEKNIEELYIYVDNSSFIIDDLGYHAYFNIKSSDERFLHDTYLFKIASPDFEKHDLIDLGEEKDVNIINYVKPFDAFESLSNCELHNKLSLLKRIFIVTKKPSESYNPKDSGKLIVWSVTYDGTLKNIIYTNSSGGNLLKQ